MTGVHFDQKQLGTAYDRDTGKIGYSFAEWIEGYYHGTGDVFGSAFVAAYLKGFPLMKLLLRQYVIQW